MKFMRTFFLSIAAIALATALVVTGTYALFTDSVTISNHLEAGTLEVSLTRKTLTGNMIDETGYLKRYEGETNVDFSEAREENIFDLKDTLIVPQMYREATMELKNDSDVAFAYWIEIVLTAPKASQDIALSKQLAVSVATENEGAGMRLTDQPIENDGEKIAIGNAENPVGVVELGQSKTFSVKVAFPDLGDENNQAKLGKLHFDMVVYAVQV